MTRYFVVVPVAFGLLFLFSCRNATSSSSQKTALHKYGFPVSLYLPEGVTFSKQTAGNVESLTIIHGEEINMQVLMFPAATNDGKKAKVNQRDLVTENPDFVKIIEDFEDGFLFELEYGGQRKYDFRKVKIVGNKEIVYQGGPTCTCTEQQVNQMLATIP